MLFKLPPMLSSFHFLTNVVSLSMFGPKTIFLLCASNVATSLSSSHVFLNISFTFLDHPLNGGVVVDPSVCSYAHQLRKTRKQAEM